MKKKKNETKGTAPKRTEQGTDDTLETWKRQVLS